MDLNKIIILVTFLFVSLSAQHQDIFPGLSGQQLLDSLVAHYKTFSTIGETAAKDSMYASIYNINDSVSCVYTDYTMYIDPALDPSQAAYNNGNGINCEHTWPKSKGASSGLAEWDLHHLFPTRVDVNNDRGSSPFDEIADYQTDKWYWMDLNTSIIPTQFIDEYSELDNAGGGRFEPREDHKGNVARAMFYFYTMYKAQADAADPQFFQSQKNILRQWHSFDPADNLEISRTFQIADYQESKPNPFVLDTTLVERAYFPPAAIDKNEFSPTENFELYQNYPNPFNPQTTIPYFVSVPSSVQLNIYNIQGQLIRTFNESHLKPGLHRFNWDGLNIEQQPVSSGIYICILTIKHPELNGSNMKKMLLVR